MAIGAILGIAQAGMGIMGAFGQQSREAAAVTAENNARISQYKQLLKQYEFNNITALNRYNLKKLQYGQKLRSFDQAAQRGYRDSQRRLNQQLKAGRVATQNRQIDAAKALGAQRARGVSGNTANRLNAMTMSQFGRDQAMQAENLMTARQDYKYNVSDISNKLKASRKAAFGEVAFAPIAGPAPLRPTLRKYDGGGMQLASQIGSSLLGGINTASTLTAPGQGINKWLGLS